MSIAVTLKLQKLSQGLDGYAQNYNETSLYCMLKLCGGIS